MRFARNSHPEWGYLAPAPGFLRTARTIIVATAIGATAGAAVVMSLVDRPAAGVNQASVSVAARTLARPGADAAPAAVNNAVTGNGVPVPSAAVSAPAQSAQARPVQAPAQNGAPAQKLAGSQDRAKEIRKDGAVTSSESSAASTAQPPAAIAAMAEASAAQDPLDASPTPTQAAPAAEASTTADPAPAQKKSAKKHHAAPRYASRGDQPNGAANNVFARPLLQRLFNYSGDAPYGGYYRFSDRW